MAEAASSQLLRSTLPWLLAVVLAPAACAKTIYVDTHARGANTGTSWTDACVYLQDALVDANAADRPVEIRVAQGEYRPDEGANQTPGDRTATFRLINAVSIRGGYAGAREPDPNARDIGLHHTVLSGDIAARDVHDWASVLRNSYHVVTGSGTNQTAVLDGFTITGGGATGLPPGDDDLTQMCGGGMFGEAGSPTLVRCTFTRNHAGSGGGMYNVGGSPTLTDCTFRANTASISGAVHNTRSRPRFLRCAFIANAASLGGAMGNAKSTTTVQQCVFSGNSAQRTGGMFNSASTIVVVNCTFDGNRSEHDGTLCLAVRSCGVLTNCVLWNNEGEICDNESTVDVTWSNVQGGWPGAGNVDADPRFAARGYWDPNGTPDDAHDDFWVEGDYHLQSEAGRWDPVSESWVFDDVTSPCIDAGDPDGPVACEPYPNGGVVNMGAYGGTAEASKSPSGLHARYGGGSGTPDDPYLIYTAEHLHDVGASRDDWSAHFRLMADIDLGASGGELAIIGSYADAEPFTGTFDGNGYSIAGFAYIAANTDGAGLFGYVTSGEARIENLTLVGPHVDGGHQTHVGALIGYLGRGTVTNCHVTEALVMGGENVGGLVGHNWSGVIERCSATGRIDGEDNVGGLVGTSRTGAITECRADADVSGRNDVGGLAGDTLNGTIQRCYSQGSVAGSGADIGGLIGDNSGLLSDCYSLASVEAAAYSTSVGGLTGENAAGWGAIENCYAAGRVTAAPGSSDVGGLLGTNGGTVRNCFWDVQAAAQLTSAAGAGRTTVEMQTRALFLNAGWDFVDETDNGTEDIWHLLERHHYPHLTWELPAESP